PAPWRASRPPPASRWHPRVAPNPLHRPLLRAGAPSLRHAAQNRPRRRHLAAAVASPRQSPRPPSIARTSTTNTPAFHSACPFACSPLRRPRTPPPLHPQHRQACRRRGAPPPHLLRPLRPPSELRREPAQLPDPLSSPNPHRS